MAYHENYIKQLQRLLHIISDSFKGYKEAEKDVESADLKELFRQIASERESMTEQLRERIARYGGNADIQGSDILGTLHRSWMGIKTAMTHKTDQTVLESCRNGDQAALDTFDDILQGDLLNDTEMKTFLTGQRFAVSQTFMELDRRYFSLFKADPSL